MSGEDLEQHANVKDILIEMGTYFQVQVRELFKIIYGSLLHITKLKL